MTDQSEVPRHYFNRHGHHVTGAKFGHYRMAPEWIDTDNRVWAEPTHFYTEPFEQPAALTPS